ncbi:MAG: hypothetical protein SGJ27_28445 [Candidatus Melainabacteria bacterium]|nr:hypothetical protein [Candidatus Melainabacteria bacterium]
MTEENVEKSAMQFEVLAANLKADHGASGDLLEHLAKMLESSYPGGTKITRGGWFMSSKRPVEDLIVRFDDYQFQITRHKHGSVTARSSKLVRGVALKNVDVSMEQCIEDVLKELVKLGEKNAATRSALDNFVSGS